MNSKVSSKCISALACLGILALFALLAVVWLQFYAGSFRNTTFRQRTSKGINIPTNYTVSAQILEPRLRPKLKEFRENSYFDSSGLETDIEYIKPMKISPLPLHDHDIIFNEMNNYSNNPIFLHHSGHFRHDMAEVWDPHPNYEIDAFGKIMRLQLAHDNNFIAPNLYITHAIANYTHRIPFNQGLLGCFYTGNVQGDADSDVVVSLCNGMTGYIRTSDGNYYIEPVEYANGTMNSFLHRIKKILRTSNRDNEVISADDTFHNCGTNETENEINNEIQEDYPIALNLHNDLHRSIKRNTATHSSTNSEFSSNTSNHIRKKREDDEYFGTEEVVVEDFEENRPLEYFIKVLVVADQTMLEFYRTKDELNHYILTLMSQTARVFKDPSIGNAISVAVIEIRILENQDFQALDSEATLKRFCEWREKFTVHSNHDVALLLTRHDFCKDKNQECTILGMAKVGGMCSRSSCAIVSDKGLPTSYTIAHELGHNLNIPHDDIRGMCVNLNRGQTLKFIMSPLLDEYLKPWMWSPCSKYYVTEFLASKKSKCLLKRPTLNFISTELANIPPGEKYKINQQCEFEFGKGAVQCFPEEEPPCVHLWCTTNPNTGCSTSHMPWAEGTYCSPDSWCHHGECIPFEENDLKPVAGGWGLWSEWGECSRTCGGGVKISQRLCDNPIPKNGGDYCFGRSIRYASCNTGQCPDDIDFRAVQCAEFNGNTINMNNLPKDVKWLPKYGLGEEDQCKLYCRLQHSSAYYLLRDKVVDGTKCGLNSFGICVEGKCRSGGCDNKLRSKMRLDDCGVCGGDNSQCEEISGSYNITVTATGYNTILKFPKGSSSLDIQQKDRRNEKQKRSYLALSDGETGKYILNGNNVISEHPKDIIFGGFLIKYSGSNATIETISTAKNVILKKPLILHILTVDSNSPPPDVTYRYIISKANAPSFLRSDIRVRTLTKPTVQTPRYSWRLYQKEWSECNSICSGFQFMRPVCIELGNTEQIVDDFYCASMGTNGIIQKKECNNHCRLIWNPAKRGECSTNCGTGQRSVKYICMKIDNEREKYGFLQIVTAETYGEIIEDSYCSVLPQPQYTEACTGRCNVRWEYSEWSQCSQTCGGGVQTRVAKCVDNDNGSPMSDQHCKDLRKTTERECKNEKCPEWIASQWGQCSADCGRGYKYRTVNCKLDGNYFKEHFCDANSKPREKMECMLKSCVKWSTGQWSQCSSTCGSGVQKREVFCELKEDHTIVDPKQCVSLVKPDASRSCQLKKCYVMPKVFNRLYSYPSDKNTHNNSIQIDFKGVADQWVTGSWSQCSRSCGGGYSSRKVACRGIYGGRSCDVKKKPVARILCNTFKCPQWLLGGWSVCDENCEKHRLVACQNDTGSIVNDKGCNLSEKPKESTKCKLSQCPHLTNTVPRQYFDSSEDVGDRYRWKIGKWKECSSHCGKGTRYRNVTCEDTLNDVVLVDQYCKGLRKPKTNKPCERFNCAFTWIESNWSPCSVKCGNGIKSRNVTCHKVYPGGLVDPNPMADDLRYNRYRRNFCDLYRKPPETTGCKESNCGDRYVWKPGPWRQCSQRCGRKGRQTRPLFCFNVATGEKTAKRFCPKNFRPKTKRKCNHWRCAHKNCAHAKYSLKTRENKDYLLDLNGKVAVVYCFKMDTREPEEYISLMSETQNYAEYYYKRLKDTNSCPNYGERNDNCDCLDIGPHRSGFTKFYKVRLNIATMKIIGDDFTFSNQVRGKKVAYGTSGDCYSRAEGCGQGRFSIDLTGTSFKLASDVSWTGNITKIHRRDRTVNGRCGGFCGECMPDFNIGLHVEVT